jgi:hypothetical protein
MEVAMNKLVLILSATVVNLSAAGAVPLVLRVDPVPGCYHD